MLRIDHSDVVGPRQLLACESRQGTTLLHLSNLKGSSMSQRTACLWACQGRAYKLATAESCSIISLNRQIPSNDGPLQQDRNYSSIRVTHLYSRLVESYVGVGTRYCTWGAALKPWVIEFRLGRQRSQLLLSFEGIVQYGRTETQVSRLKKAVTLVVMILSPWIQAMKAFQA